MAQQSRGHGGYLWSLFHLLMSPNSSTKEALQQITVGRAGAAQRKKPPLCLITGRLIASLLWTPCRSRWAGRAKPTAEYHEILSAGGCLGGEQGVQRHSKKVQCEKKEGSLVLKVAYQQRVSYCQVGFPKHQTSLQKWASHCSDLPLVWQIAQ